MHRTIKAKRAPVNELTGLCLSPQGNWEACHFDSSKWRWRISGSGMVIDYANVIWEEQP